MKKLIYISLLNFLCIHALSAQCSNGDASIWQNTWASCSKTSNPKAEYGNSHWIQYDLGTVRDLSKTWVWNTNDPTQLDQGFNLVKIDYSEDGQTWTHLGEMNFPKAKGDAIYSGFSGPDFSNIKAQYVLLTAISNHGDATCAGLAEIKFNLNTTGETIVAPPTDGGNGDNNGNAGNEACSLISAVNLADFAAIQTGETNATILLELAPEIAGLPYVFEYRATGQTEWLAGESMGGVISLENLQAGTTYEYRIALNDCQGEANASALGTFQTLTCAKVSEIIVEEVLETEAFLFWEAPAGINSFLVQLSKEAEVEPVIFEVAEAEIFLENLLPNTNYSLSVGIPCGEAIIYSDIIEFSTLEDEMTTSMVTCPTPTGMMTEPSGNRRTRLSWNKVENAIGYRIQIRVKGKDNWRVNARVHNSIVKVQGPMNTYEYRVKSLCEDGEMSDFGAIYEFSIGGNSLATSSDRNSETGDLPELTFPSQTFSIFPNPTRHWLQLERPFEATGNISIHNLIGQELWSKQLAPNQSNERFDVRYLETGIYFLKIQSDRRVISTHRFIKG